MDVTKLQDRLNEYYSDTAGSYDSSQIHEEDEHQRALSLFSGFLQHKGCRSLLDVGCGTGRGLLFLQEAALDIELSGLEPVETLRDMAVEKGFSRSGLHGGSATALPFEDSSFDAVMMLGVLHHLPDPGRALVEAVRVAKRFVLLSDHNIYGWGSPTTCLAKRLVRYSVGFKALKFMMTRGRGYHDTDYDGIFYPFSLLDHLPFLRKEMASSMLVSTVGTPGRNFHRVSHLAYIGKKLG